MTNKFAAALMGVWLLAGTAALAQSKPDFSGDWVLNKEKSVLGSLPAPDLMLQKIEHKDPDLKVATHTVTGPQSDINYEAKYTTDGKECLNKYGDQINLKSKLVWERATLDVDTDMLDAAGAHLMTFRGKWTLSADGKVLTEIEHIESPQGSFDVTYVFDKR
jgi:hypothetical protein